MQTAAPANPFFGGAYTATEAPLLAPYFEQDHSVELANREWADQRADARFHTTAGTTRVAVTSLGRWFMAAGDDDVPAAAGTAADNRAYLRDLALLMEDTSLMADQKLRVIRNSQGYMTVFVAFLEHEFTLSTFLMWSRLETLKEVWDLYEKNACLAELADMAHWYMGDTLLEANISHRSRKQVEDVIAAGNADLASLDQVELDLCELLWEKVRQCAGFIRALDAEHALITGPALRVMPTAGKGLSVFSRSKGDAPTSSANRHALRAVVDAAYSTLERVVLNGRFSVLLAILQSAMGRDVYADVVRFTLWMCAPYERIAPLVQYVAAAELEHARGFGAALEVPITTDLLCAAFYDATLGLAQPFLRAFTADAAFASLLQLSGKYGVLQHGNKPVAALVLLALREFASLLDRLAQLVESVAAPFRAMLQRVHTLATAKAGGTGPGRLVAPAAFVTVLSQPLVAPKLFGLASGAATPYFLAVLRDILKNLLEGGRFLNGDENVYYNNFLTLAAPLWTHFWAQFIEAPIEIAVARHACLARLRFVKLRASADYRTAEEFLLRFVARTDAGGARGDALWDALVAEGERLPDASLSAAGAQMAATAVVIEDYVARSVDELTLREGQTLRVTAMAGDRGRGIVDGDAAREGTFPLAVVVVRDKRLTSSATDQPKLSSQVSVVMETRMREFEAFLGNKFADEVLLFWSEASAAVSAGLAPSCRAMHDKYVAVNASAQIPFSGAAVDAMTRALATGEEHDLADALLTLMGEASLMLHDHCMDFLQSQPQPSVAPATITVTPTSPRAQSPPPPQRAVKRRGSVSSSTVRQSVSRVVDGVRARSRSLLVSKKQQAADLLHDPRVTMHEQLNWTLTRMRSEFVAGAPAEHGPMAALWEALDAYLGAKPKRQPARLAALDALGAGVRDPVQAQAALDALVLRWQPAVEAFLKKVSEN